MGNGRGPDYTALEVDDQIHQNPSRTNLKKGKTWCVKDVCGIFCAVLTWFLILYAEFVVLKVILLPYFGTIYSIVNTVLFQAISILAFSSHVRTMLTDPGAVPRGNATKENIQQMGFKEGQVIFKCPKCCSIKPERAHHCSVSIYIFSRVLQGFRLKPVCISRIYTWVEAIKSYWKTILFSQQFKF